MFLSLKKKEGIAILFSMWVLDFPEIELTNLFTPEVAGLIFLFAGLVFAVLLCLVGYNIFGVMMLCVLGSLFGYIGLKLSQTMTDNAVLQMFITIMIGFMAVCAFYFGYMILTKTLSILPGSTGFAKYANILSPLLGGILLFLLIYIFRFIPAAAGFGLGFTIIGLIVQHGKRHTRTVFHTYDDLRRLPRQEEKNNA